MKKRTPGKVGSLYRLAQPMMLNSGPHGVLTTRSLPVGTVLMITEKRKAVDFRLGNADITDYRVLTTDGEVGWLNSCTNRWFYSDFKFINANILNS